MISINKELLIARLSYLDEIHSKPGGKPTNPNVISKIKELIEEGEISSYMTLESVYNYLEEKLGEDVTKADSYAKEIISFLN